MFPRLAAALLLLAPLMSTVQAEEDPNALSQPVWVAAASLGDQVLVSWTPGIDAAEEYRVYGVIHGVLMHLDTVHGEFSTTVAQGYSSYGVSAVKDGVESRPTFAAMVTGVCVTVHDDPPGVAVGQCPFVGDFSLTLKLP